VLRIAYAVRNAAVDHVPLPYVFGQVYGPVPPWVDGLRLLEADPVLLWRGRPHAHRRYVDIFAPVAVDSDRTVLLRQFWPTLPASLQGNPVWDVRLDSRGFRQEEFGNEKPSGTVRIACLGDSWTFGGNVAQGDAYPQGLARLLNGGGGRRYEVLNLGVLGYSSHQGLRLLESQVLPWRPDVVTLGFAMNDASVAGYRDAEAARASPPARSAALLEQLEIYRLLRYWAGLARFEPPSPGDTLRQVVADAEGAPYLVPGADGLVDFARLEGRSRVAVAEYEANVRRMVSLAGDAGAHAVLLYNELAPHSPYRDALRRMADSTGTPLVDTSEMLARARRRMADDLSRRHGLRPAGKVAGAGDGARVVFRLVLGERAGPASITGADPQLGSYAPNTALLHDDGTHGDERAGDGVWSLEATFPRGARVFYVYTAGGRRGAWEGLDVPQIRGLRVPDVAVVYRPIETFGRIYMQADSWHTNAEGNAMIASALYEVLSGVAGPQARLPDASGVGTARSLRP
jgi:lysophospholipase L1-like esterase